METILLIAIVSILNIVCFFIGAKVGQKVVNKEELKLPTINPVKVVKEYEDKRAADKEQERINVMLENIDNYTGNGIGQKDIPR